MPSFVENINTVAGYINLSNAGYVGDGKYLVTSLPDIAREGDLAVNVVDGGIYQYTNGIWTLVAQSAGGAASGTANAVVPVVPTLPANGVVGEFVFNTNDGLFYAYVNGAWSTIATPPATGDVVGIEVFSSLPEIGVEGQIIFNTSTDKLMKYINGAWAEVIQTSQITGDAGIAVVADNPLTAAEGEVIFNTTLNQLLKYVNGVWIQVVEPTTAAADVADGSITTAKFAAGIRPIEIVSELPTVDNTAGRLVYLTTDGKVYRYTATGFTAHVEAVDLTGTITETQIGPNAVTAGKIAANSITATKIVAGSIDASKITANAISAGHIQAGAIGADEIAANAITAAKINASAITAEKIATNAIDATKIVAGSIGATQIATNAITAGKISAGAVDASKIAANSIDASKIVALSIGANQIASNSITAGKIVAGAISTAHLAAGAITANQIAAGAITASKLSVDSLSGTKGLFTSSNPTAGSMGEALAAIQTNSQWCLSGRNDTGSGDAVGVAGNSSKSSAGVGVYGVGAYGVVGVSRSGQYGLFTHHKGYAAGGFTPFTGAHIVYAKDKTLKVGMTVSSSDAWCINISQTLIRIEKASLKAKNVVGVVSAVKSTLMDNITNNPMIKEEHKPYIDYMKDNNFFEVEINSVGEGGILVSNINGNIDNGDYLMSDGIGYAMKQADDILHNYTVAKALESVDWSKETATTKMIACTYHCG